MPIDVRMPDGTLVKNVPDNITQADLLARYNAFSAQPATSVAPEIQVKPQAPQVGPEGAPIPSILQNQEPPVLEQTLLQKIVGDQPDRGPKGPGVKELASDVYAAAKQFPEQLASSAIQAYQGKDVETIADEESTANKIVEDARKAAEANMAIKGAEDIYTDFLGAKIKRSDIRNLPQNLSFSLVAMGSALLSGLGTTAATKNPIAGYGAGAATAGKVAYNIDTNSFLRDLREGLNQASIEQRGIPITNEEFVKIAQSPEMQAKAKEFNLDVRGKGAVDELANIHGLHEAGWEAISSTVGLGAGKYIFKEALKGKILKPVAAFTGELGLELAGETATQLGQSNIELKAGMHQDAERSWSNAQDWKKSYKEVAGPTILTTAVLGGAPAAAGAAKRAIQKATQPPTPQERVEPEVTPPEVSETPVPVETVSSDRVLLSAQTRLNQIETKMKGTPDYEGVGPDGQPRTIKGQEPQIITDKERAEYDFLKNNITDLNAIAKTYGLTIDETAGLPAKETTEVKTSHDTQAMLDELSGKDIEYVPEEDKAATTTTEVKTITSVPDSAFNGDLEEGLNRVFLSDAFTGDSVPLTSQGFRPDEVKALEDAGLATDGRMNRQQYGQWMEERSARISGKSKFAPAEEVTTEVNKQEPTGVITEEDKEFTPVGGRLINKADADKLARESAIALQQNLATQEAEKEATLKREIREEKFREPPTQTLSAKLVEEGGISRDQKRDMLGETGKVEGYDHVFREKGGDLLTLVKDGKLDEYLPPDIRTTATPPNELYDARPGYNYISDLIKTGEKIHTYDYEMAKLQHENMVYEKNLAKQQMTPNEAAQAAAAEEQGKIFLSQGKIKGGTTPDVADSIIRKILGKEGRKLLDDKKLRLVASANQLDTRLLDQITNNTRAFYDPVTNTSYIITDRVLPYELKPMILHEVGVHYGMRRMLGDVAYKNLLANIEKLHKTDAAVKEAWDTVLQTESYAQLLEKEESKAAFLEEVLAHLGESAPNHSLWKRIVQAVKTFLIKNNIIKDLSSSEIKDLVTASLKHAAYEKIDPSKVILSDKEKGLEARLQQANTPEFKQWFGDSKIVDEKGNPKVMYHGTKKDIDQFKSAYQIAKERDPRFGAFGLAGIYFTPDASFASMYAKPDFRKRKEQANVLPVYLRMENPYVYPEGKWAQVKSAFLNPIERFKYNREVKKNIKEKGFPDSENIKSMQISRQGYRFVRIQEVNKLKAQGYDGIISPDGQMYIVFEPNQIKSAIGNKGTFDTTSANILESQRQEKIKKVAGWTDDRLEKLIRYGTYYGANSEKYAREYAVMMTPDEFLGLTTNKEMMETLEKEASELGPLDIDKMKEYDVPMYIKLKGPRTYEVENQWGSEVDTTQDAIKVNGHEGRHRAILLKRAGVEKIPVVLMPEGGGQVNRDIIRMLKLFPQFDGGNEVIVRNIIPINRLHEAELKNMLGESTIKYSQRPPRNIKGQEVLPQWHGPEESKVDEWIYRLQNKQIDTKRVQELIGDIEEDWNVYDKEQLYHGRTASGIRNFLLKELLPVIKEIERLKISPEDIRTYLHNRHAEERNNQMNKINPDVYDETTGRTIPNPLKDKGSGISTADARAYLAGLDPARKQLLEQIATKFDQMVKGTQQILINSGAESQDTINKWNSTYEHYVPLFRIEDEMARPTGMGGTGQGFGVRGAFSKRAMGSEKDVQDILSNIIAQRERALIRAEKIRVGRALYGLAIQNPNPDFWLPINPDAIRNRKQAVAELRRMGVPDAEQMIDNLMAEPKERYLKKTRAAEEGFEPDEDFDFDSGLPVNESKEVVASKVNVMARYKDFVFPVRINGKDRYIFFNKNDPRALRMVQALKNLDAENLGYLESIFGRFTRWFKNVNTQYNPVFGLVNFLRDMSGTFLNLTNTEIKGKQAQVIAGAYKAMGGILNVHRAERKGKPLPTGPWATLYQEARDEGFQTGYRDSLIRNQEEMQIVERTLSQFKDGNTKKAFYAVLGGLTDYNDMMENAFRLSAYKVARDQGLSKQKAAIIAKNLTVNFDRKGAWTSSVNALYAFFNASVQGTERIYQTLKGPKGRIIIGGGILAGMVQAVMLAAAGYGDDDPPEFVREKNFIIPLADGTYITVPYPLGYNILPNSGRIVMDFMIHGGRNPGKHTTALMSAIMNSFNPLGSSGFAIQTLMPTAIDPLVALAENKDAFGRPIYRPDRTTAPTPGYTRSRDTSSTLGKGLAEFLNWASGGTKYTKGSISPTADEIDFLAGQVGGGLYREVSKAAKAVGAQSTGEALAPYQRPLVSRFYGETGSPAAVSQTFYNNITRMTDHENEIKGRMKNREDVQSYLDNNPEARLWKRANSIENKINELNKRKRTFIQRGYPKERVQAIDAQKTMMMQRFNDQVSKLTPE